MLIYRSLAFVFALLLFAIPVYGQPAVTPDVDLRTYSEEGEYYLVFNGKKPGGGKSLGHAFVTWLAEDPDQRMSVGYARGLWPVGRESNKKKIRVLNGALDNVDTYERVEGYLNLVDTEGDVRDDADYMEKGDIQFVAQVNSESFDKAKKVKENWDEDKEYKLLVKNCVSFVDAVAESVGLDTPSGSFTYPGKYVSRLKQMN